MSSKHTERHQAMAGNRTPSWRDLVDLYKMEPLPREGGMFVRTHTSEGTTTVPTKSKDPSHDAPVRPHSTAIYYLLRAGNEKSALHVLDMDEVWHFYLGGQLTLIVIHPDGELDKIIMGHDVLSGEAVQHVVPAGSLMGAFVSKGDYALVGNTNAPGFVDSDCHFLDKASVLERYPQHAHWIDLLSP